MKKRIVWLLAVSMSVSMLAGCQKEEEPKEVKEEPVQEEVKEEPVQEEPEVITLGTESEDAVLLSLKNSTGKEITGYWMRASETEEEAEEAEAEEDWGENMMTAGQTIPAGETFLVYYLPKEETAAETEAEEDAPEETGETDTEETMLCDLSLGYGDNTSVEIYELDILDVDMTGEKYVELCTDPEAAYVKYTSVRTKEAVDTKEAVLAKMAEQDPEVLAPEEMKEEETEESSVDKKETEDTKRSSSGNSDSGSSDSSDNSDDEDAGDSQSQDESQEDTSETGGGSEGTGSESDDPAPPEASVDVPEAQPAPQPETPPASSGSSTEGLTEECGHWYDAAGNEVFPE